jgi:hypothetical protein
MKTIKKSLRFWFLGASLTTFLGGWLMLAHSPKPIQPAQSSGFSLSSLLGSPSRQGFGDNGGGFGISRLNRRSNVGGGFPILRTGGS